MGGVLVGVALGLSEGVGRFGDGGAGPEGLGVTVVVAGVGGLHSGVG